MATAPHLRPPMRLVFSYAREDEELRDRLEVHLRALERAGLISCWHDRDIRAGRSWREQIEQAIAEADIVLLLISPDFIASDYCFTVEMTGALRRHASASALVIPVLLRPVVAAVGQPWAELQSLPRDLRAVVLWPNLDEALATVAREVLEALENWSPARPAPRTPTLAAAPPLAQDRVLDAAVPSRVRVGQTSEVVALVRRQESGGLRAILAADDTFSARPEAVRSQEFELAFPCDEQGRRLPLRLTLVLESPDFDPPRQTKRIQVPPADDSPPYVFLVVPRRPGLLALHIELLAGEVSVVSHLLRSQAEEGPAVETPRYVMVSLPLLTLGLGARTPATEEPSGPPTLTSLPEIRATSSPPSPPVLLPTKVASRPHEAPSSVPARFALPALAALAATVFVGVGVLALRPRVGVSPDGVPTPAMTAEHPPEARPSPKPLPSSSPPPATFPIVAPTTRPAPTPTPAATPVPPPLGSKAPRELEAVMRATLEEYRAAFESLSFEAVQRFHPTLSKEMFHGIASLEVDVQLLGTRVGSDRATADYLVTSSPVPKTAESRPVSRSFHFRRQGETWVFDRVE